jgi:hypothetical protein
MISKREWLGDLISATCLLNGYLSGVAHPCQHTRLVLARSVIVLLPQKPLQGHCQHQAHLFSAHAFYNPADIIMSIS